MQVEQKNRIPAAEVLSEFFRFAKARKSKAEEVTMKMMSALRREERCYGSRDENFDSGELAHSYHRRMLIGVGMAENSKLPRDLILFSATLPAFEIAEMSCGVACESGRLLEISEIMQAEMEELDEESALTLEGESEGILHDIFGTIFLHVLRAYGHDHFADLYEMDIEKFEARCESGRKLLIDG